MKNKFVILNAGIYLDELEESSRACLISAIVALKNGARLLKCGKRGKPKFCIFRLSCDEKLLIWYSKEREKCLSLSTVPSVVLGQKTTNLLLLHWPEKEPHSLSVIYKNGECSLDLICKDKDQAECWHLGLTALVSALYSPLLLVDSTSSRRINSCTNSPPSYIQQRSRLFSVHDTRKFTQVRKLFNRCEMKGARADDPIVLADDDGDHRRTKKRKNIVECTGRCHCARDMIVGPRSHASTSFQSKCVFAEKLEISRCEINHLRKFFKSAKPAIKHYVCEMKRTFVTPGQRMYFFVPFTKQYLMDYISSPIKKMRIVFLTGAVEEEVCLMKGQDNKATITTNWSQFVKSAKISQDRICVFSFHTRKGKLWVNVHRI